MQIITHISDYVVAKQATVRHALNKIDANKSGTVFIVDVNNRLIGVLTDGDFRRWLTGNAINPLDQAIDTVMNRAPRSQLVGSSKTKIRAAFNETFDLLPLVDERKHLKAIAIKNKSGIIIKGRTIDANSPTYVIAEIGNNHNGNIDLAKKMVEEAVHSGADCVKFQMRNMASVYKNQGKTRDDSADLGAQYVFNLLEKFQLENDELLKIFDFVESFGVTALCTPWDMDSLAVLESYGMPAYKVASADLTNTPLLYGLSETGKPLFCSTGMSTEVEINQAAQFLDQHLVEYVLLHCNSTYPAPLADVNLRYLKRLQKIGGGIVGYSGHELGTEVALAAVAMGAKVVEKHFTLDKTMEGNDHKVSLTPSEFKQMTTSIRRVEEAMGEIQDRTLSQGEMINRETLAKSLVANQRIEPGDQIIREAIDVKSPGQGLAPYRLEEFGR